MSVTPATIEPCSLRAWFCCPPEPAFDCWKLFPLTAVWSPTVFVFRLLSLPALWSAFEHFFSYVGRSDGRRVGQVRRSWTVLLFRTVWMLVTTATIEPCSLR